MMNTESVLSARMTWKVARKDLDEFVSNVCVIESMHIATIMHESLFIN